MIPARARAQAFDIRLNAMDFKDLQNKVSRPIIVPQNITFHKTLLDRFIDAFKEEVNKNPIQFVYSAQVSNATVLPLSIRITSQVSAPDFTILIILVSSGVGSVHRMHASGLEYKTGQIVRQRS